jgi:AcrR family transcriptional regulator
MVAIESRLSRDEKKAITRRRLLDAGADVFASRGFEAASLDEVAERAGLTKGAVYSNFASKEDLFLDVLDDRVQDELLGIADRVAVGDPVGAQTNQAAQLFLQILQEQRTWFLLSVEFTIYAARHPEKNLSRGHARAREMRRVVVTQIEQHAAELDLALPLPADELALALMSIGNGIALEKLADPDGVPDDLFAKVIGLLYQGFAPIGVAESAGRTDPAGT